MKSHSVVFISFNDYDNLGVGYLASVLSESGFETRIIDVRKRKPVILKAVKDINPLMVGFSVIFLNHIYYFTETVRYLRKNGIKCHFTAGGHYASLRYKDLFNRIPELDSIIRFEGEYPVVELAKSLAAGKEWRNIRSISYSQDRSIITNPAWPPEIELDRFPFPYRQRFRKYAFGKKFTAILAGRGCVHNCSFCNTRAFYRKAGIPLKRLRKPGAVVEEMRYLYNKKQCSVFLFHDDDFPLRSEADREWVKRFCSELESTGLDRKVIWKINCRPDDITEETFSILKEKGLFLVFLGIEDGTDSGLMNLKKNITSAKCTEGIRVLKKLQIGFDFGFMLFQPDTTFRSLNENLDFLRKICRDGYTPVTFLKLLPLYETRIENELERSGRLKFSDGCGDYDFTGKDMNEYYNFIADCLNEWLRDRYGLENISRWARNYYEVYFHFFGQDAHVIKLNREFVRILSESNLFLISMMKELSEIFRSQKHLNNEKYLGAVKKKIKDRHELYRNRINENIEELMLLDH